MADNENYVLPIMPITWGILAIIVLASYLISKLADLCFDHYLINYTNYEHRDMIKARFQGELKQLFIFKKKDEPKKDNNGNNKISILPLVVNEVKREIKRIKKEEENSKNIVEDRIIEENEVVKSNGEEIKSVKNTTKETSNQIKLNNSNGNLNKENNKQVVNGHIVNNNINPIKSDKKPISSKNTLNIKQALTEKSQPTINSNNNQINSSINKYEVSKSLVKIEETSSMAPSPLQQQHQQQQQLTQQQELKKNNNMKNPVLLQIWNNHPYNEKILEKHQENKKKLLKEKLKIFVTHKPNTSLVTQSDDQNFNNSSINDFKYNINNKSPNAEMISLSDSYSSGNEATNNYQDNKIAKNENELKKKRNLVKQSTVETMLSSENYYKH